MSGIEYFFIYPLLWLVFYLAAKFLPNKNPPQADQATVEAAGKKYGKVYFYFMSSIFFITPILVYLISKACYEVQRYILLTKTPGNVYIIGITIWAFLLPALFLGLFIWAILISYLLALYAKITKADPKEWDLAVYYQTKTSALGYDIDFNKLISIFAVVLIPISLSAIFLGMDNYTKITDKGITYNGYFDLKERRFSYKDINRIVYISKFRNRQTGQIESASPYFAVITKGGFKWDTLNSEINQTAKESEIISYISQKSGVTITSGTHNIDD